MHRHKLDLNLLLALRALLAERNVTRAAERAGLSQSAMSHALARLRAVFDDPVLVRTPSGMQPTPRAEAMAGPLERALDDLARAVSPPAGFEPSRARRRFRIATDDYVECLLLPKLLQRLWREAPGIDVSVSMVGRRAGEDLAERRVDTIISIVGVLGPLPGAYTQRLFDERFVCAVRADHPAVGRRLTLETFVALPHALVAPGGRTGGIVDAALAKLGHRRRVAVSIPHFLVAPRVVRETDLILTIGERVAKATCEGLRLLAPPLELPNFTVSLLWHERNHADPAHIWFRSVITEVARTV